MSTPHNILAKYWNYQSFRPLQEDVIKEILENKDVLALMPTGGGKSICYQVPGMMLPGLCLVVSPLLALIEDQVSTLRSKGISAETVHSMMPFRDMDRILDNCIYGDVKFLFVSPERLRNDLFKIRLAKMNISMLAVDEAHCISQWGHDFRPAYRQIIDIREVKGKVPILALTATATAEVVKDIQEQLAFGTENVLQQSFRRENISFHVSHAEDKRGMLLYWLKKYAEGSMIVYARNRKKCRELAEYIQHEGITVTFYHAGLSDEKRKGAQEAWMKNDARVVVATNAFGMGIDKADVRAVIHYDLSDGLESYYQEAGRAGRDGRPASAIQLLGPYDVQDSLNKIDRSFPDIETVKHVYQVMCDRLSLASGSGQGETFGINLSMLSNQCDLNIFRVLGSLKTLELNGQIELHESLKVPSRVMITSNSDRIQDLKGKNDLLGKVLALVIRSRSGIFAAHQTIREEEIARLMNLPITHIDRLLVQAHEMGVIDLIKRKGNSSVTFLLPRLSKQDLRIDPRSLHDRKDRATTRLGAMIHYVTQSSRCRSIVLLEYFGEKDKACENCDVCSLSIEGMTEERRVIIETIRSAIQIKPMSIEEIKNKLSLRSSEQQDAIRWLIDKDYLRVQDTKVYWNNRRKVAEDSVQ